MDTFKFKVYFSVAAAPVVAYLLPSYGVWGLVEAASVVEWGSLALMWGTYFALVLQVPNWHFVGVGARWVVSAGMAVAVVASGVGVVGAPWGMAWLQTSIWEVALRLFVCAIFAVEAGHLWAGRSPGETPVDLEFPFAEGRYWYVQAGSYEGGNKHLALLDDPDNADIRGQARAVDIVELGDWGLRARGLLPRELSRYAIFGRTVCAPCDGRVVVAEDGHGDHPPPECDQEHAEGNHVWLDAGEFDVLLAHLREGSLQVEEGERVEAGEPVAEIGNSGRTTEPHLHIHAQRPGEEGERMAGEPLPIRFDGEFPTVATSVEAG